ncbi:MAG: oxygen-independent coproporphyrinogen-3 oxidase [Planctomycetota bacterium]|jgi:oxygen-independent coproporphyrinogen-3 oxidase|uniref:coproporphyrinogen-III oxidase family protein n=1 Tax=Patiriisocius sp. Uisw_047 TaxID=3230969 RepID=UPI0039ECE472
MAGIYIHIPFCKQACHYCDFHFSTSLKNRDAMVDAICKELKLRKSELEGEVHTIYFGGGTPSLLTASEIAKILNTVHSTYKVTGDPEVSLEANPDDLVSLPNVSLSAVNDQQTLPNSQGMKNKLQAYKTAGINRLSIGVQSFFEEDLKLMNRAHNANEAIECIIQAKEYFENISLDLIYGIPKMTQERWLENIEIALGLDIPHLSCYALTVEPKTALEKFIKKGIVPPVEDDVAQEHHQLLIARTEEAGYDNYEFSNFSRPGWESKNNTAYWEGKPYLGVGPSAHSFDGAQRGWNIANNAIYLKKIANNELPIQRETLSKTDRYNEYVMTGLRTKAGVSLLKISEVFGEKYHDYLVRQMQGHLDNELLFIGDTNVMVTKKGKFLSDGIASDLFLIN